MHDCAQYVSLPVPQHTSLNARQFKATQLFFGDTFGSIRYSLSPFVSVVELSDLESSLPCVKPSAFGVNLGFAEIGVLILVALLLAATIAGLVVVDKSCDEVVCCNCCAELVESVSCSGKLLFAVTVAKSTVVFCDNVTAFVEEVVVVFTIGIVVTIEPADSFVMSLEVLLSTCLSVSCSVLKEVLVSWRVVFAVVFTASGELVEVSLILLCTTVDFSMKIDDGVGTVV